jgi:hypothetical protein
MGDQLALVPERRWGILSGTGMGTGSAYRDAECTGLSTDAGVRVRILDLIGQELPF